jgi:hypothetical protein
VRRILKLIPLWVTIPLAGHGQNASTARNPDPALVERALTAELTAAQDRSQPMRYRLRKSSPRLTTTKDMVETVDGTVAMLVAVNDLPPSEAEAQKEKARLDDLLADPAKQRHRKQSQDTDTGRALKVLRVLPSAFLYQYAGAVDTGSGIAEKYAFSPNPKFDPPDLETEVLTAMTGEIWIDPAQARIIHLQGRLAHDVDFGWGMLGRLYKGGWITIDQANVSRGLWRIVKFQMDMQARVIFRTREIETTEIESDYTPVPATLDYKAAIQMLRAGNAAALAK